MPYQPDPILVRRLARKVISIEAQAIRDLSHVDIGEELEDEFTAVLGEIPPQADWDALAAAQDDEDRAGREDVRGRRGGTGRRCDVRPDGDDSHGLVTN